MFTCLIYLQSSKREKQNFIGLGLLDKQSITRTFKLTKKQFNILTKTAFHTYYYCITGVTLIFL